MRDYGKVASTFWTGSTGRSLRADRDSQVVALYLVTGPLSNMIGLYHLPLALLSDHTGIPVKGASKALRRVCDTGFCHFEGVLEHVFVPEMAAFQVGEPLKREDKRVAGIISQWQSFRKSPFYLDFYTRYATSFHLPEPRPFEGASGRDARAGSQEQAQEQEHAQEQDQIAAKPPPVVRVRERDLLWDAIVAVTGADASIKSKASHIGKVRKALAEANPPYGPDDVLALPGVMATQTPWAAGRTITLGEVESNIHLVRSKAAPVPGRGKIADIRQQIIDNGNEFLRRTGGPQA